MELDNMQSYGVKVNVSGDCKRARFDDEGETGSGSGSGRSRGSQASSDAIFRSEELERLDSRAIVRTTKVTIVTS